MSWLYFEKSESNDMISAYLFYPGYIDVCEGFITYSKSHVINKIERKQNVSGRYSYIGMFTNILTLLDVLNPNEAIWLYSTVDYNKLFFLDTNEEY